MTNHVNPRVIELDVDGIDRSGEISKAVIRSGAPKADRLLGGPSRSYTLAMTIAQDHASGSLWRLIWDGAGLTVTGTYAPYGIGIPSPESPHFTFTATISEPEGDFLGGEATTSTQATAVIEVEWDLIGRPIEVTE